MVASRLCVHLTAVLFTLGKLLYAHSQFDVELLASAFWKSTTIVVLLLLFSWTPALKPLRGNLLTILLSITASLVFLGDLLYYRLYQDWPSLSSLPAAPQLTTAGRSMLESLQLSDLWLFADLPVLLLLSFKVQSPERPPGKRYRLVPLTGPAVLCLGFISMLALFAWNPGLVHSRMRNSDYVIYQGLVLFHAFDVLTCTTTRLGVLPTLPQEEILPLFKARRHSVGEHIRFFGAHRGSNVLMVQLESFESFPLNLVVHGQEVTPFCQRDSPT